ncbi:hypothetical protein OTU49_008911 [Cherax quadricarinatus]|uniref:ER membrane protein complex subunit 2 n=1 Tax=Cherax quadricarinatus TaxID=27406 RepID=A0AAW0WMA5_CHEQU
MASLDLDWEEVREQLRAWREDNTRHSEEVIDMWEYCLKHYKHKLGDERWMVEEQVVVAGLDSYRLDIAEHSLVALNEQFPGSLRVRKLKGMRLEALERFMSDGEAWQELCDLYLKEGDYSKAAFCMEELILTNPHNHLYYTRYAEIKYTQRRDPKGGLDNMEIARSYFCQAAKLNPGNVRALYGLFLSCTQVSSSTKCSAQKKKETQQLATWALKEIADRYSKCRTNAMDGSKILETFGSLSITEKA